MMQQRLLSFIMWENNTDYQKQTLGLATSICLFVCIYGSFMSLFDMYHHYAFFVLFSYLKGLHEVK